MNPVALLVVAIIAGVAVALQGQFMGSMDRAAGTVTSVFITYGIGAAIAAIVWLVKGQSPAGVRQIPWYAFSSGVLGLVIVGGIGYAAPRLGLSKTIVVAVAAQLLAALLIDHYALFGASQRPLDAARVLGFSLAIAGVWLIVRA